MANRLADLKKVNRLEDMPEVPWDIEEPAGITGDLPRKEPWVGAETITKPIAKGFRKTMGAVSWPFERASALVATPYRELLKERQEVYGRHKRGEVIPAGEAISEAGKAVGRGLVPPVKSLVTKELHPEAATIPEVVAGDILKDSPYWTKIVLGLGAEFAIAPAIVGGALRAVAKGIKLTGIPAKISARRIPEWQRLKTRARMKTQARIEKAGEVVRPLRRRDVKKLAQELSKRTGKKISPSAVKQRLTQIIKGSVVAEPGRAPMTSQQIARIAGKRALRVSKLNRESRTLLKAETAIRSQLNANKGESIHLLWKRWPELGKSLGISRTEVADRGAHFVHEVIFDIRKGQAALGRKGVVKELDKVIGQHIRLTARLDQNQAALLAVESSLGVTKIAQTGITAAKTIPPSTLQKLANPAIQEFSRTSKELTKLGILPKETYLDKLSKTRITELLAEKTKLQGRLAGIYKAPYKHTILNAAEKLKVSGQPKLAEKLIDLGIRVQKKNPELGIRLGKVLDIQTTQPQTLLNTLARIEKSSLKGREAIISNLEKLAVSAEKQRVIGKVPLIKKVSKMQRRFPGQSKLAVGIKGQIDDIEMRILQSYHPGADVIRLPDGTPYISGGATRYFPRIYESKELERAARNFPVYGKEKIRAPYAKQRQRIPEEIRKAMGEITKEPAYPVAKRLIQQGADIETAKLFQQAAAKPGLASKIWYEGLSKKALPDDKAYGALRGMFVKPRVYDEVTELFRTKGKVEQLYDTLIGTWKTFRVTYSPSTQFRNKFSNKILLDMSGMGYGEQAKYAGRVLKEWKGNTRDYQVAKRYFARTTMIKGELFDDVLRTTMQAKGTGFEKALNSMRKGVKKGAEVPARVYQHEEIVGKMMKYFQQRDLGKSVIESVEEANKWLFDYSDLTKWERLIARRVMPFYTFPRKALPRVAEALAERPHVIAKYPLMAKTMTQASLYKLDITDKDFEKLEKTLPKYMKGGSYILMPYRDVNGDLRFFDWTYIIPWGEIAEIQGRGVLDSVVTNPLVQMVGDIQRNKSSFTEREIWKETDTFEEKTWKQTEYIWRNLVPSLMWKGQYWDKLSDAATGKPSKYGKVRPIPETVAHTIFGMRTQAIDEKRQVMFNYYEQQEKRVELAGKLKDIGQRRKIGNISESEYQEKKAQYKNQLKEIE